jgi:hypothetical protein
MDTITIYRAIPRARVQEADRAAGGTIPTRAFRYCEPMTAACGWGFWIFPPDTLTFTWDGQDGIDWAFNEEPMGPLEVAQYPDFAAWWDAHVPARIQGYSPPFLFKSPEPGTLVVWTGLLVQTAPGWSLSVRAPVNLARTAGYEQYEGIVETDVWFGPLFANLRLHRIDQPVTIERDHPLMQIQPLPRHAYLKNHTLEVFELAPDEQNARHWQEAAWDRYYETVITPQSDPQRRPSDYAVRARQRRSQEARGDGECPMTPR